MCLGLCVCVSVSVSVSVSVCVCAYAQNRILRIKVTTFFPLIPTFFFSLAKFVQDWPLDDDPVSTGGAGGEGGGLFAVECRKLVWCVFRFAETFACCDAYICK